MSSQELTDEERNLIQEEEDIFRGVIEAIYEARRKRQASQEHLAQRLEDLGKRRPRPRPRTFPPSLIR